MVLDLSGVAARGWVLEEAGEDVLLVMFGEPVVNGEFEAPVFYTFVVDLKKARRAAGMGR